MDKQLKDIIKNATTGRLTLTPKVVNIIRRCQKEQLRILSLKNIQPGELEKIITI